jgi:hypothetical protein
MKKLVILFSIIMGLFIISFNSAGLLEFQLNADNLKDRFIISDSANKYPAISIKFLGLIDKADLVLTEHTETCGVDCSSIFNIEIFEDSSLIDEVIFETIKGEERIEEPIRDYKFYIQTGTKDIEVNDYGEVCNEDHINGSKICSTQIIGTHTETNPIWEEYTMGTIKSAGSYTIKLEGKKSPLKEVDWKIITQGELISDWAVWGEGIGGLNIVDLVGGNTGANTLDYGLIVKPNYILNITYMIMAETSARTQCAVKLNSTGATLATGSVSGSNCYINYSLTSGTIYRLVSVASGSQTVGENEASYTYPQYANGTTILGAYRGDIDAISFDRMTGIKGFNTITIQSSININSPANNYTSLTSLVSFNATASVLEGATLRNMSIWTNQTGTWARNQTTIKTGTTNTSNWTITFSNDGNYIWGVQACDSDNDCGFSENRTLSIDSIPPTISLLYPTGTIPYGYSGQNISLNYSISDANIQSCWMNYNGTTNLTLTCNKNGSLILGTPKSIIIYANDSAGNLNTSSFSWDYNIFEYNRTFNNESISGSNQGFNITIYSKNFPSLPYLFYNNTNYLSTINNLLSNNYILSNYITLPSNVNAKNYTFYWNITDSSGVKVNTYSSNQSVLPLAIDDCSVYTFLLFNFTIKDEDTQVIINHTNYNITSNLNFNIYGPSGNSIGSFNKSYTIANPRVCLKTNSSGGGYYVDGVIDYQALSPYIHKFYYLSNYGTEQSYNIDLFDLLSTRSQEFLVTYKDINFLPAPNILIYVNRNYISENLYKTVEVVKTNNNGQALIHLVLSNIIYSFTFVDADTNSILSTLGNYVPFCNNIATGDCTINSNAVQTTINTRDYTTIGGISFTNTFNSTNRSITSTFTSVSGLSNVNQTVVLYDRFGNTTICSSSLNSPSGILTCNVPFSYGNISLLSSLYADNELVSSDVYTISKDSFDVFGYDGILWTILIIITITMLFITSPMGVIIAGLVGLIISTFLGLLNGGSIFGKGAYALIWIIISAIILIWKINKGESQ